MKPLLTYASIVLSLLLLTGCPRVTTQNVIPDIAPEHTYLVEETIGIGTINSGENRTSPLKRDLRGASDVTPELFSESLYTTLIKSNIFKEVDRSSRNNLVIEADLVSQETRSGFPNIAILSINYRLLKNNEIVWEKIVTTRGANQVAARAVERAVKNNLRMLVSLLPYAFGNAPIVNAKAPTGVAIYGSGKVTYYEVEGNLEPTNALSCIQVSQIQPTNTPADITIGAKKCAENEKYDQAAELIMFASAYGHYDAQRVADKTAHGALNALFSKDIGTLQKPKLDSVMTSIDLLDENKGRKEELCSILQGSGPPQYIPTYMIAHGMESFSGENKDPIVNNFNSETSWNKSLVWVNCQ